MSFCFHYSHFANKEKKRNKKEGNKERIEVMKRLYTNPMVGDGST